MPLASDAPQGPLIRPAPAMAAMLLPMLLCWASPAVAVDPQGQLDCAKLRSTVLQLVGDWSKEMLLSSRDMSTNGWLDANVANAAFKDVQLAVMYFDHDYEVVPKNRQACRELTFQFGMGVGTYIEQIMTTGIRPENGLTDQ